MKVPAIYTSSILKKTLKFASDNSALFNVATSCVLAGIIRPLAIMATPNTDLENKKYAVAKSLSSKIVDLGLTFAITTPFAKAIENIKKNPEKYLKENTIKNLQNTSKTLEGSKDFRLATQIFNLGLALFIVIPKQYLTSELIPKIIKKSPEQKKSNQTQINFSSFPNTFKDFNSKNITFKGKIEEFLSKKIGSAINSDVVQNFSKRFSNTKFELNLINLTDVLSTLTFVKLVKNNKNIKEEKKKPLMYNSLISTGLSLLSIYSLDKLTKKPEENFIKKFTEANKNSADLPKYINGFKVLKPVLLLGLMYYTIIPIISTFLSDKLDKKVNSSKAQ